MLTIWFSSLVNALIERLVSRSTWLLRSDVVNRSSSGLLTCWDFKQRTVTYRNTAIRTCSSWTFSSGTFLLAIPLRKRANHILKRKIAFQFKADHAQMWSLTLSVTWQRWRSHHSIRRFRKPHATHKHHGSMFYRTVVMPLEVLHCGNKDFRPFSPVTLTLTRWLSYTTLTRISWRCRPTECADVNIKAFDSYRLTDRQTRPLGLLTVSSWHTLQKPAPDFRNRCHDFDDIFRRQFFVPMHDLLTLLTAFGSRKTGAGIWRRI